MSFSREVSRINGTWPNVSSKSWADTDHPQTVATVISLSISICTFVGKPSRHRDSCTFYTQFHLEKKSKKPHTLENRTSDQGEKAHGTSIDVFPSSCR